MDESRPRHDQYGYRHYDYPPPQPIAKVSEMNAGAGIQVALTVLALAALPISAWLYIATYVESQVDTAIARHDKLLQVTIADQAEKIEDVQGYMTQLCTGVRKIDPQFSCLSANQYKFRFNYNQYDR